MAKWRSFTVFSLLVLFASCCHGYLKLNCLASTNTLRFSSMQPSNQGANHGIKLRMCGRSDEDQRRVEKAMAYAKVFKEEGVPSDMRMFNVNKVARGTDAVLADSRLAKVYMYAKMFNEMPKSSERLKEEVRDAIEKERSNYTMLRSKRRWTEM